MTRAEASGGARILLVDDDDDFAAAVSAFLAAHGYVVRRAGSGREGLEMARHEVPDLVLLDVMMEERTAGIFALQEMRRDPRLAGVPVFVVTSLYAEVPGLRVSPDGGWLPCDAFLAKPVELPELLDHVRRWLPAEVAR